MKSIRLIIAVALVCISASLSAKVTLPAIISDNMVLQQNTEVTLWGKAEPGAQLLITPGWDAPSVTVKVSKQGSWEAKLKTAKAGGPYDLTFNDGEVLVVGNVLLGEVWFCSGQSNMVMPMRGFTCQPVEESMDYIVKAKPSRDIRVCSIKRAKSVTPLETAQCKWMEHTPEAVSASSATAYFFAEYLNSILDVPVGVIVAAWGGAKIKTWMDRETLKGAFPEVSLPDLKGPVPEEKPQHEATILYNGMVAPITSYTIKGLLWYQGCSDSDEPALYERLVPAYVDMMRTKFGNSSLPFYYVQIAPYKTKDGNGRYIREAQLNNLKTIPNSGMVVTTDAGDTRCIHPAKKKPVGQRLALLALYNDYGIKGFDPNPPTYESMSVKCKYATLKFNVGESQLAPKGWDLDGFEVAGEDKVFHPAVAKVKGKDELTVACDKVEKPVAVRYNFSDTADVATLFNLSGIPASPFRTDKW